MGADRGLQRSDARAAQSAVPSEDRRGRAVRRGDEGRDGDTEAGGHHAVARAGDRPVVETEVREA